MPRKDNGRIERGSQGWLDLGWERRRALIKVLGGPNGGKYAVRILDGRFRGKVIRVTGNRIGGV